MHFKQSIQAEILSRMAMWDADDFITRMKLHNAMLPTMIPQKWDVSEPIKKIYNPDELWDYVHQRVGYLDELYWVRTKKTRSEGTFSAGNRCESKGLLRHAKESIKSELSQTNVDELIAYVKQSAVQFKADIAYIECWTKNYFEQVIYEQIIRTNLFAPILSVATRALRYWLDDVFWVTIFGDAYVRLFGMKKLLSVPAYKVEKLNDETVFIQLTENVHDVIDDFAEMQRIRQAVKDHLDPDAFFHLGKAFYPSESDEKKLHRYGRCKVFNTPKFRFLDDNISLKMIEADKRRMAAYYNADS